MTYHEQNDIQNIKKIRSIISVLPAYCEDFFRGSIQGLPLSQGLLIQRI